MLLNRENKQRKIKYKLSIDFTERIILISKISSTKYNVFKEIEWIREKKEAAKISRVTVYWPRLVAGVANAIGRHRMATDDGHQRPAMASIAVLVIDNMRVRHNGVRGLIRYRTIATQRAGRHASINAQRPNKRTWRASGYLNSSVSAIDIELVYIATQYPGAR